jgi:GxxExxY protein
MDNTEDTESTEQKFGPLTEAVIGAAIEVHRVLGPGLLESVYEKCLARELAMREIRFRRQVDFPVVYKGATLDAGFRADLVVEDELVVEIKAADAVLPIHVSQLVTYLRVSGIRVGLLLNFNVKLMRDGVRRVVA